jgi:hypothetical protein
MTTSNEELVRELQKRDNQEIAQLLKEATAQRPPAPPSEYVLLAPNGVDFVQDHGECVWSETHQRFMAQDAWSLRPFHAGNPHVGNAFPPPTDRARFEQLQRLWHQLRIEEAETALAEFKEALTLELDRTQRSLVDVDLDRVAELREDLQSRQDAYDEAFLKADRAEAKAARKQQSADMWASMQKHERHEKNAARVSKLFEAPIEQLKTRKA